MLINLKFRVLASFIKFNATSAFLNLRKTISLILINHLIRNYLPREISAY